MARDPDKSFSIEFADSMDATPADLLERAHEILVGIADSLKANAELNLARWRFEYRIERRDRRIVVVDARRADA